MATRFLPRDSFACRVGGVRYLFSPAYVDRDGFPGYPELPAGLNQMQRDSFYAFEAGPEDVELEVVESATAVPGVKRAYKPRAKVAKSKVVAE